MSKSIHAFRCLRARGTSECTLDDHSDPLERMALGKNEPRCRFSARAPPTSRELFSLSGPYPAAYTAAKVVHWLDVALSADQRTFLTDR